MTEKKELQNKRRIRPACCDIFQNQEQVVVSMEMPGVTKENLDVRVDGDLLIIDGKKTSMGNKSVYLLREIRDGDYHHEFTLDDTIDRDTINASIKNGVVTLTLGLKESEKPRKIEVS